YNDGIDDYYGWISYYGLWFPDQVSITNGTPVQGVDFDTAGNLVLTPYEVFTSGGRLIKYTRGTVTLGEIRNVPMNWGGELYTGAGFNNYIAIWNGSSAQFEATAIVDYDAGTTLPIAYAPIDLTNYDNITFWSDSLGGYVRVDLMAPTGGTITPDNSTTAITYNVEVVYPGTEDPALGTNGLLCFENCPNATPGVLNSASPMYPASTDWSLS
ncbi:MAG: hypothetical protein GWN58_15485, partial [Anaerolineae bacterium]|nr:hypothetical protein [Anaerolineae bacterium]